MKVYQNQTFADMVGQMYGDFLTDARPVDVGQWQGLDIRGDSKRITWEIREAVLQLQMAESMELVQQQISPNLPWAEDHFQERVSGQPLNPPPSSEWWPFKQNGHGEHVNPEGKFSHTYPERFWPKHAGDCHEGYAYTDLGVEPVDSWGVSDNGTVVCEDRAGIRFSYGDLNDVVDRLVDSPMTRQAYLPVWFPEDTGAPEGERVPCTIGYHFMIRDNSLHVSYTIRACDFMRHFRDDVYMAIRLGQWVRDQVSQTLPLNGGQNKGLLNPIAMGELTMHIGSFHIFTADRPMVKHLAHQHLIEANRRILRALQ